LLFANEASAILKTPPIASQSVNNASGASGEQATANTGAGVTVPELLNAVQ